MQPVQNILDCHFCVPLGIYQVQCEVEWWIFWGRLAGGLNRNQQTDVYQRLSGFLLPRGSKKPPP